MQEWYRLPFLETPDRARFSNNKSAINNSKFTQNSIKKMLATGTILETDQSPRVVNPLSVSIDYRFFKQKASHFWYEVRQYVSL